MENHSELNRFLADSRIYFYKMDRRAGSARCQPLGYGEGDAWQGTDGSLPEWHPYAVWRRHVLADR